MQYHTSTEVLKLFCEAINISQKQRNGENYHKKFVPATKLKWSSQGIEITTPVGKFYVTLPELLWQHTKGYVLTYKIPVRVGWVELPFLTQKTVFSAEINYFYFCAEMQENGYTTDVIVVISQEQKNKLKK